MYQLINNGFSFVKTVVNEPIYNGNYFINKTFHFATRLSLYTLMSRK